MNEELTAEQNETLANTLALLWARLPEDEREALQQQGTTLVPVREHVYEVRFGDRLAGFIEVRQHGISFESHDTADDARELGCFE